MYLKKFTVGLFFAILVTIFTACGSQEEVIHPEEVAVAIEFMEAFKDENFLQMGTMTAGGRSTTDYINDFVGINISSFTFTRHLTHTDYVTTTYTVTSETAATTIRILYGQHNSQAEENEDFNIWEMIEATQTQQAFRTQEPQEIHLVFFEVDYSHLLLAGQRSTVAIVTISQHINGRYRVIDFSFV